MPRSFTLLALSIVVLAAPAGAQDWDRAHQKKVADLARRFWKARPPTRFEEWDEEARAALFAEAEALGAVPEGRFQLARDLLWKPTKRYGPRCKKKSGRGIIETPYGDAWFYLKGGGGPKKGMIVGLHGGGPGAGSADGPAGTWAAKGCLGMYPQGIVLVHDTWNTVHGERFVLSLIEIAKAQFQVDPDRIYCAGFSMGGTGSWFMAGRHADLLAGASPCAGVLMAKPKSQLASKDQIVSVQHGLVPNVRNLAMWYYIGLADKNCMPGTYLFVADMLADLRADDPTGYRNIHFKTYPGLAHAFPPAEPKTGLGFLVKQRRDTFPEQIVWEYVTDPFPQPENEPVARLPKTDFYWLRCTNPVDRQVIRAKREGNAMALELEGRSGLGKTGISIWLNGAMIDPQKEVVVTVSGQEVYRGKPEPRLSLMLESLDGRVDRSMLFDRRIDL